MPNSKDKPGLAHQAEESAKAARGGSQSQPAKDSSREVPASQRPQPPEGAHTTQSGKIVGGPADAPAKPSEYVSLFNPQTGERKQVSRGEWNMDQQAIKSSGFNIEGE